MYNFITLNTKLLKRNKNLLRISEVRFIGILLLQSEQTVNKK